MPQPFAPQKHHRKSTRLQGYDYAQAGVYFVTIVTFQRECLFGDIVHGEMRLNDFGVIAEACWRTIPEHFPFVDLGAHVIMPNHVHGILVINGIGTTPSDVGATHASPLQSRPHGTPRRSLGAIIGSFKSAVSRQTRLDHNTSHIWQRNYHDRIIRNQREMDAIWQYIEANPAQWEKDDENPKKGSSR